MEKFVDVILPLPLPGSFTYSLPAQWVNSVWTGCRVVVPFGKKKYYTAIVYRIHENKPKEYEVKEILSILDTHPVLFDSQFRFWEWLAEYYLCTQIRK